MERERLETIKQTISADEERRLRALNVTYQRLLRENSCLARSRNRARKNALACDTLWRQYEEILNTPRTYWIDPPRTEEFRQSLGDHRTIDILAWTAKNYRQQHAQVLIAQLGRSMMLLILTLVVGVWYHATTYKRKALLQQYRSAIQ